MEQDKNGRMGSSAKPDNGNNNYTGKTKETRYEPMPDYYLQVSPQLNEPLYTRPVREFIPIYREWCERRSLLLTSGRAVYSILQDFETTFLPKWLIWQLVIILHTQK